jgi:hypothetical protein
LILTLKQVPVLFNRINKANRKGDPDPVPVNFTTLDAAVVNLEAALTVFYSKKITEIASEDLVAEWLMNGDATDNSGNGYNLIVEKRLSDLLFYIGKPFLCLSTKIAY